MSHMSYMSPISKNPSRDWRLMSFLIYMSFSDISDMCDITFYKEKTKMSEKELTKKIQNYLNTIKDCFYWKEHGGYYGTAGIPDIIVCYRGRFIAFEVKAGGNQPTALQKITIRKILKAGGYALVVRSVEEVTQVIEAFKGD
jgi:hypothetical protein